MNIVDIDNTQGDLRVLAMAVQALIETHPDKAAFLASFKQISEQPEKHSLYSPKGVKPNSASLIQDIMRTASSSSKTQ